MLEGDHSFMNVVDSLLLALCTALGVLILWAIKGQEELQVVKLANFIALFCEKDSLKAQQIEFVLFIVIGSAVGLIVADPETKRQALIAGLAWTGICANPKKDPEE